MTASFRAPWSNAARSCGAAFAATLLSACSLAPAYIRPEAPVPPAVTAAPASAPQTFFLADRSGFFKDPRLQDLIAFSLEHNRDLRVATLAVAEAGARYGVQRAERLPALESEGQGSYTGGTNKPGGTENYEIAGLPAFELDLFGRLRSMSESAFQSYLATEEAQKAAVIALVSQTARAYFDERLAEERLRLARDTLGSWTKSHAFIESRVKSGQSSLLELEQARSMLESAAAGVAEREGELMRAGNALRLLSGSFAERELPPALPLKNQWFADLPEAVSSEVLLGRPDIMEAERNLLAANADIGAARAAFFPSVSLTGNLRTVNEDLSTLFSTGTGFWAFLPTIRLPIFSGGKNAAELDLAEVRKESSVARYEKSIQTAFREVADALQSKASYLRWQEAQERWLASQRLVLELAVSRYIGGAVSYLEVLDAQRGVFQTEQDLLGIRRDRLVNEINLYSALGGGLSATSPGQTE